MNKYQEAFYRITDYFHSYTRIDGTKVHEQKITYYYCRQKEVIRELVEKATPKKPTETHCSYNCPTCGSIQTMKYEGMCIECQNEYCGKCGQKLDWSCGDE